MGQGKIISSVITVSTIISTLLKMPKIKTISGIFDSDILLSDLLRIVLIKTSTLIIPLDVVVSKMSIDNRPQERILIDC